MILLVAHAVMSVWQLELLLRSRNTCRLRVLGQDKVRQR